MVCFKIYPIVSIGYNKLHLEPGVNHWPMSDLWPQLFFGFWYFGFYRWPEHGHPSIQLSIIFIHIKYSSPIMTLPHTSARDHLWLSHLTEHFIITMYLTSFNWGEMAEYVTIDLISGVESQGHVATTASKETYNGITHSIEQIRVCRGTNRRTIT